MTGYPWNPGDDLTAADLNQAIANNAGVAGISTVTATGSTTARKVADRFADRYHVADFGAVGNGASNDTAAVQAALTAAGNAGGGEVEVGRLILLCGSLSVPAGVTLQGEWQSPGPESANCNYYTQPSQIILTSGASIALAGWSAGIRGLIVSRQGLSMPALNDTQAATLISQFSGVAIIGDVPDIVLRDILLLGHTLGVQIGLNAVHGRAILENVRADCTGGILLNQSRDVSRLRGCHVYNFLTWGVPGVTQPNLSRAGVAFSLGNADDWTTLTDCFTYGFATGFLVSNSSNTALIRCQADSCTTYAFDLEGTSNYSTMSDCFCVGGGLRINVTTDGTHTPDVRTSGCKFIASPGIKVDAGQLYSVNDGFDAASQGIVAAAGTSGQVIGAAFVNVTTPWTIDASAAASWNIVNSKLVGTSASFVGPITSNLSGPAGSYRQQCFQTAGINRWALQTNNGAESGANAGSDFDLVALSDTGANLGNAMSVIRSTQQVIIGNLSVSGSAILLGSTTIRTGAGAASGTQPAGSLWLRTDGSAGSRLYISAGGGTWAAVAGV